MASINNSVSPDDLESAADAFVRRWLAPGAAAGLRVFLELSDYRRVMLMAHTEQERAKARTELEATLAEAQKVVGL